MTSRFLPLVGSVLFFGVAFCWRPWLHARRYGSSGIVLFRGGRGQNLRDSLAVALFVLTIGQAIVAAAWPHALAPRAIVRPGSETWPVAGAALMAAGIALLVIAQLRLGASWRIGIEEGARPGLETGGLYRLCRNPIFLAMLVTLTGYAVLLPTWLSAALLLGAFAGIRRQALAEEAYLLRAYGDAYRAYARRVGRFLPGIGRLT